MLTIHIDTASLEHADRLANRILSLILIQIGQCGFDFCTSDTNKQVCSIRCAHRHDRAARIFQRRAKRDGSRSAGRSGVYDHVRLPCIASGKAIRHRLPNRLRIQSHNFTPFYDSASIPAVRSAANKLLKSSAVGASEMSLIAAICSTPPRVSCDASGSV